MRSLIFLIALLCAAGSSWAQAPLHSSIQKLEASYRIVDASTEIMQVTQHMHIGLNTGADVQTIHVVVKDAQTDAVVYQVSYTGNTTQTAPDGRVLFSRNGNTIEISNPTSIDLRPFTYELTTENSSGQLSELFTDTQ